MIQFLADNADQAMNWPEAAVCIALALTFPLVLWAIFR